MIDLKGTGGMATVIRGDFDLAVPVELAAGSVAIDVALPVADTSGFFGMSWVTRGELADVALL